jgi:hypothetical protein
MLFHIRRLQLVILLTWVVVIPPDTAGTIVIDTSCIWEAIALGIVKDFGHKAPGTIENSGGLGKLVLESDMNQNFMTHARVV